MERCDLPLYNENAFKLGIFCLNVSGGTAITRAEGTLTPTWEENVRVAQAVDEAGWEFLLPLGRWRGFGGDVNFNDKSFEVFTWAAGIAAVTKQIQVMYTSHVRYFHPVVAAKQGCTVDHIAGGRSALNVVAGQKPDEICMFGIDPIGHDDLYEATDEWLTLVKRLWTEEEDFDFEASTSAASESPPTAQASTEAPSGHRQRRAIGHGPALRREALRLQLPVHARA